MFWKYNHQSSTHIETLLNKEDVTLQELMDEEDVLQECKVQNKRLIDFLVRPEVMEELVRLTTVEPSNDLDEKQRYKYPNVACELLTCDVPTLNERLAGDEELLGKLYTFLETETPLNPLLASFFSKTFGVLVARKSEQNWYSYQFTCLQVLEFLKSKENFITLLLKHLGTSAIMDLMLKLITHIEGAEMKQNILNWLDSQQVIQCLVGLLDPTVDEERNCNASHLLCDVIRMSRENQHTATEKIDCDPILNRVEDPETVSKLLDHMLGPEKHESSIVGGVTVLLTLLDCSRPNHEPNGGDPNNMYCGEAEDSGPGEGEQASKVILTTLETILPRLKDLHKLLLDPPYKPVVKTTAGILDPPLGNTRLHIAKLLATIIAANHPSINKELAELGTVETLLDLFFKYSWNNFLHSQVEQCLAFALNAEVTAEFADELTGDNNVLLKNIFIKCRLLQRILEAWEDNDTQQSKSGGLRRGYMGHLIKIANVVASQAQKGMLGAFIKEHVPEDTLTAWDEFTSKTLYETNKTHSINLGGARPVNSSSEDDDPDYPSFQQDSALQQAFSDYQMQQMAPQFIENYGFHDEEFPEGEDILHRSVDRLNSMTFGLSSSELDKQAEMFKKVCAQKIQQGLDNADGDMWNDQDLTFPSGVGTRTAPIWQGTNDGDLDSSDEEEQEGPEARQEIHMEVDSTDPWTTGESTSDVAAVDSSNPWNAGDVATLVKSPGEQGGWADFGSGGFADFEANFAASSNTSGGEEIAVVAASEVISTEIVDTTLESPASPSVGSPALISRTPKSDNNANPSSFPVGEQVPDNHRFLPNSSEESLGASVSGGGEPIQPDAAGSVKMSRTAPAQLSASSPPPTNTETMSEGSVETVTLCPETKVTEDSESVALASTPNGPI